MVRFDAYTATTTAATQYQLAALFGEGLSAKEGPGYHQFGHRVSFEDPDLKESVGAVLWGGRHGDRAMIEVKGERTPEVVERLRSFCPHRTTRLDSCADFESSGAFNRLVRACMAVKRKHRLKGEKAGDWDDFPEDGRTLYLGARTSPVRLRLYEKGKQPEYRHLKRDEWVRAEIQLRPKLQFRDWFSNASPLDVWGATQWARELAGDILAEHVDPHPAGTVYRVTAREQKLMWMCRQYGAHLLSLKEDLGTWECVGLTLGEMVKKQGEEVKRGR